MSIVITALSYFIYFIIADAVLSWVQGPEKFPRKLTSSVMDPIYKPIRAVLDPQKTGGFDLSPIILIVGIQLIQRALLRGGF